MNFNIQKFLNTHLAKDEKFILACSAGADSMFLLYQILQTPYKKNCIIAHFNHQTREQCAQEEAFLCELGEKEGLQVEIGECDFEKIQKLSPSKSFEELAREKRYDFFQSLLNTYNTNKILTAHHLDDKIETFFFNMLRGSKLSGLVNMTEHSTSIYRPLIGIEKKDILKYMQQNKLKYFEDETNSLNTHTRNYLRNEVLPLLENVHPEHKKNLSNLMEYFGDLSDFLDSQVQEFLGDKKYFTLSEFYALSSFLQKEVIRYIYFISNNNSTIGLSEANIAEVLKFFQGKNNKTKKEIRNMKLFKDGEQIHF